MHVTRTGTFIKNRRVLPYSKMALEVDLARHGSRVALVVREVLTTF